MLNADQLRLLFPRAKEANLTTFLKNGANLFDRFGLSENLQRLHYFLAQIGHESAGLTRATENLNYSAERLRVVWPSRFTDLPAAIPYARNPEKLANFVYANRMGNGAAESGEGWRYRGRGYIQITGKDAYEQVGSFAGLKLAENPDLAVDTDQALLVACAVWQWKDLNPLCDAGDFVSVTRRINGGTNGLADRRAWLDKIHRLLEGNVPDQTEVDTSMIIAVQRALQAAGFPEVGAADGKLGRRTLSAISRYRQERGLPPGQINKVLIDSLNIADDAVRNVA